MARKTPTTPAPDARVSAEQLASLSHEFRTPLNGVLGMARLLEGTGLTAEQRAYVAALRDSGEHLLALVNDVLDFAKLGADKIELHPATMDVEGLLRSVSELLSPRAQEKGLEVAWAAPPGIGQALADEGRLRQILLNFAGNAVKFTETGGVLLSVTERDGSRLRFSVSDTGPGVTQAAREKIFEAFAQADPSYDGAQLGGAGLGLAIARKLAAAMDGEVGVEDAPGGGALFWFEAAFPRITALGEAPLAGRTVGVLSPNPVVAEAARRQIAAAGGKAVIGEGKQAQVLLVDHALAPSCPPDSRPAIILLPPNERARIETYRAQGFAGYLIKPLRRASLAERVLAVLGEGAQRADAVEDERIAPAIAPGARVLLVEDNAINALLARTLLAREGCKVDHAGGGEDAMAALKVGRYDLILMDMRMPGMSGLDATRALRASGLDTPVVALTANAFEDDRHACLAAGMNDFLVKPLAPDALRGILARLTRGGWTETPDRAKVG
ncbi:MAG: response regulator [Phenylobacterium sp.]|uniref:response regulator n=1 Tax=Phenylobacterium sp. TaxID=1871053 RepID=UPI00272758F3|nr:response regulator [Phenylobacterium sp.]MDO8910936.1 response regulator [Phenylobacterium sp.]MDP2009163.1 response regulator [Phenylobacterium sp.]MDP3098963.1 response regulator [Phenylobacterium sp.]MDP3632831.1 response regulator [Phenylobacterium sp.]HQT52067.1 response regulator [Phenylobacterium sp.]